MQIETTPLYNEKGKYIGQADNKTGMLYKPSGNLSRPGTLGHKKLREAAEKLNVINAVNTQQWEEEHADG